MTTAEKKTRSPSQPAWIDALTEDELRFVERFLLCSGSLKALASEYGVSYPTLRNRLDGLIARVQELQSSEADGALKSKVRKLLRDGAISVDAARQIVSAFEEERKEWEK
ncbi:MAG: DUF2089 family protein [Woeseiaceae bacterium]|nr:DUF2089 family protein [Woeseiaceae bacterium]